MQLLSLFALIGALSAHAAESNVKFYYGKVVYSANNGSSPSSAVSLVKRTVSPEAGRIDELVTEKDDRGGPAKDFPTVLKRRGGTKTFDLDMEGAYVTGSLTFDGGEEWNWTRWTYDMTMTLPSDEAVRKIEGAGGINSHGAIVTNKRIHFIQGSQELLVVERRETLDEISSARYTELYGNLHP